MKSVIIALFTAVISASTVLAQVQSETPKPAKDLSVDEIRSIRELMYQRIAVTDPRTAEWYRLNDKFIFPTRPKSLSAQDTAKFAEDSAKLQDYIRRKDKDHNGIIDAEEAGIKITRAPRAAGLQAKRTNDLSNFEQFMEFRKKARMSAKQREDQLRAQVYQYGTNTVKKVEGQGQ